MLNWAVSLGTEEGRVTDYSAWDGTLEGNVPFRLWSEAQWKNMTQYLHFQRSLKLASSWGWSVFSSQPLISGKLSFFVKEVGWLLCDDDGTSSWWETRGTWLKERGYFGDRIALRHWKWIRTWRVRWIHPSGFDCWYLGRWGLLMQVSKFFGENLHWHLRAGSDMSSIEVGAQILRLNCILR